MIKSFIQPETLQNSGTWSLYNNKDCGMHGTQALHDSKQRLHILKKLKKSYYYDREQTM